MFLTPRCYRRTAATALAKIPLDTAGIDEICEEASWGVLETRDLTAVTHYRSVRPR